MGTTWTQHASATLSDRTYKSPAWSSSDTTHCSAAAPPPPLPPLPASSSPPPPPAEEAANANAVNSSSPRTPTNPGPYEQITLPSKRLVNLDTHDGFRVDISKQLSPYMVAIHSFWLGSTPAANPFAPKPTASAGTNNSYTFVTQVANEAGLLMARVDPQRRSVDGRIHAVFPWPIHNHPKNSLVAKVQLSVSPTNASDENDRMMGGASDQLLTELDIISDTWTANIKYGAMGGGLIYGCNYYQAINHAWALGGEGMYIAANQNLMSSFALKYETPARSMPDSTGEARPATKDGTSWFVGQFHPSQGMLSMNYKRLVTGPSRVTLGAELTCSVYTLDSQVALGAEFNLTRSKVAIAVDGTGRIQSMVEAKLGITHASPTLSFSADVDHSKDVMKFGYGLNIGG